MTERSSPDIEALGWPSLEVVAREIRRAMLDNPTDDSFNKRAEKREAIANEAAGVIMARFCAAVPPSLSSAGTVTAADEMRQTAAELRANSNGDCNAAAQAIMWDKKAAALDEAARAREPHSAGNVTDLIERLKGWDHGNPKTMIVSEAITALESFRDLQALIPAPDEIRHLRLDNARLRDEAFMRSRENARPSQLCSCKASDRDGQHMAWCPSISSTDALAQAGPQPASPTADRICAHEDCLNCSCSDDELCAGTQPRRRTSPMPSTEGE